MNERKIRNSLIHFCQNPYWREYYTSAPSEECKRYVALQYYSNQHISEDEYEEYRAEREKLKQSFKRRDWAHLLKYSGHNPARTYYSKMMKMCAE